MLASTPRQQFLEDYARIRAAEGRGSEDSAYYRALPFFDPTGRNSAQWRIRARTFKYFKRKILPPFHLQHFGSWRRQLLALLSPC